MNRDASEYLPVHCIASFVFSASFWPWFYFEHDREDDLDANLYIYRSGCVSRLSLGHDERPRCGRPRFWFNRSGDEWDCHSFVTSKGFPDVLNRSEDRFIFMYIFWLCCRS